MPTTLELYKQLHDSIRNDVASRIREHQASMAAAKLNSHGSKPLAILAHGDSWFNYPLDGNSLSLRGDTDIIAHLKTMGSPKPLICNISHFGDAATVEMGLPKQQRLVAALADSNNWFESGKPDAILISGGGNDIVGDVFCVFLNYAAPRRTGLNAKRLKEALGMVDACYQSLFDFRDKHANGVPIFGHCYDFAIPNNVHPICAGPWLHPSLKYYGWTQPDEGKAIVREALGEFKILLQGLADDANNHFFLVNTQDTLKNSSDWANELHPNPPGFKTFASLFADALASHPKFQGRIYNDEAVNNHSQRMDLPIHIDLDRLAHMPEVDDYGCDSLRPFVHLVECHSPAHAMVYPNPRGSIPNWGAPFDDIATAESLRST